MGRIAYVDGMYVDQARARVSIEDRGYQFADGVYEVWGVEAGRLLDHRGHLARLQRSLRELRIEPPMSEGALNVVLREVLRRNRLGDAIVYLQITRGAAPRDHAFPAPSTRPVVVVTAKPADWAALDAKAAQGSAVITCPDQRWARVDIKTVSLLPNVLAKQAARERGAAEAWMVDDQGHVTEGSSSNAWIVDAQGVLISRPLSDRILAGVTRATVLRIAADLQWRVEERPFTVEEAKGAHEAFNTAATALVSPVISIDGAPVGDGRPGPVAQRLRELYRGYAARAQ